jgi:nicotinamide-nucleotide amidase
MSDVFPAELVAQAAILLDRLRALGLRLVTAESCTGGLVAGLLTEVAGSSDVVERGFVTYSNAAKSECLGVPAELIAARGAVSAEVARAMAEGALRSSHADIAVAVTGVAGPGGGSVEKPVGLVHLAAARAAAAPLMSELRLGPVGRGEIRLMSVREALRLIEQSLAADEQR